MTTESETYNSEARKYEPDMQNGSDEDPNTNQSSDAEIQSRGERLRNVLKNARDKVRRNAVPIITSAAVTAVAGSAILGPYVINQSNRLEDAMNDFNTLSTNSTEKITGLDNALTNVHTALVKSQADLRSAKVVSDRELADKELEIVGYRGTIDGLQSTIDANEAEIAGYRGTIDGLQSTIDANEAEIAGLEKSITGNEAEIAGLEKSITGNEAEIAGLEKSITGNEAEIAGLEKSITGNEAEIAGYRGTIDGLQSTIDANEAEIAGLEKSITGNEAEIAGYRGTIDGLQSTIDANEAEIAGLEKSITGNEAEIAGYRGTIDGLQSTIDANEAEIAGYRGTIDGLQSTIDANEAEIADLKDANTELKKLYGDLFALYTEVIDQPGGNENTVKVEECTPEKLAGRIRADSGAGRVTIYSDVGGGVTQEASFDWNVSRLMDYANATGIPCGEEADGVFWINTQDLAREYLPITSELGSQAGALYRMGASEDIPTGVADDAGELILDEY